MEIAEVKETIDGLGRAFDEFKKKNNARLDEVQKRGYADPLLESQVDRVSSEVQRISEMKERLERLETRLNRPAFLSAKAEANGPATERKAAVMKYLRTGDFAECKALSVDGDPQGGYWVQPEMSSQVIKKIFESSPMRAVAQVETVSSDALEIPEDVNEADAGWTSERSARSETNSPNIGVRRISVHELYAMPKATQTLLDDAKVDVESWLASKIADKISRLENSAFVSGDGVGQPRGILTYPAGTANPGQIEQVNSGSAAAVTADGLRALFYRLKSPYLKNARWLTRRSTIEAVSKLKDNNGQYLWEPGLAIGEPQTLLGQPIERMEDMPAVSANALSIVLGDFKQAYVVVDRAGVRILRDPYSGKPFVLFYTTKRAGGDVTNFEALVIQKIAA
ncbi:MAG: phage major capsid protein [Nitrospinae bacterium]|nr:phage major capsid protein [Nitrospinota bacterium]